MSCDLKERYRWGVGESAEKAEELCNVILSVRENMNV